MEAQNYYTEDVHINLTSAGSNINSDSTFTPIPENQFITIDGEFRYNYSFKTAGIIFSPEFEIF